MIYQPMPVTEKQVAFVRALQRQHRLPDRMLDSHCEATFGAPFAGLDRGQVSALIDEMVSWQAVPADLMRAQGQLDLFEPAAVGR